MIDIHSHILPGIDDGPESFDGSLEIIKWLVSQGVTDVIATPHFINETIYISPKSNNQKLLKELKDQLIEQDIKINLFLGNEIYINDDILSLLSAKKITTLADSKYLLIEMPLDEEYPNYQDYFKILIEKGYKVILAHPERYSIIQSDFKIAKELHESGVLFQCNIGSIIGRYGKRAQKTIKKLIKNRFIFAFGSDTHRAGKYNYIEIATEKLLKYYSESELKRLFVTNPRKILSK